MKKLLTLLFVFIFIVPFCLTSPHAKAQEQKTVYLTFDDGPSHVTESVLDILRKNKIKATFFVIGKNVEKHPEILAKVYAEGHTIGIHSYSHEYKQIYADAKALEDDIVKCYNSIKKVIPNYKYGIYRFPGGSFFLSEELLAVPKKFGLKYYDWNASCRDCELVNYTPEDLRSATIETSYDRKKIILLAHDGYGKGKTALALQGIIDYYNGKGYAFKTLK